MPVAKLVVGVAVGVLLAAAVIFAVYRANQPSDFDCAAQRAEYALGNIEAWEIDDACR